MVTYYVRVNQTEDIVRGAVARADLVIYESSYGPVILKDIDGHAVRLEMGQPRAGNEYPAPVPSA